MPRAHQGWEDNHMPLHPHLMGCRAAVDRGAKQAGIIAGTITPAQAAPRENSIAMVVPGFFVGFKGKSCKFKP